MPEDRREAFYHERLRQCGKSYPAFDLPSVELMINFLYTADLLQQSVSRYLNSQGLSKSALNVLLLLRHGNPEGMQLHDLGELLLVSRANVTGLIDNLEEKRFVSRVVDPADRRARLARITQTGEALLEELMPTHLQNVKTLLRGLSNDEKDTLLGLFRKARASVAEYGSECEPRGAAAIRVRT